MLHLSCERGYSANRCHAQPRERMPTVSRVTPTMAKLPIRYCASSNRTSPPNNRPTGKTARSSARSDGTARIAPSRVEASWDQTFETLTRPPKSVKSSVTTSQNYTRIPSQVAEKVGEVYVRLRTFNDWASGRVRIDRAKESDEQSEQPRIEARFRAGEVSKAADRIWKQDYLRHEKIEACSDNEHSAKKAISSHLMFLIWRGSRDTDAGSHRRHKVHRGYARNVNEPAKFICHWH